MKYKTTRRNIANNCPNIKTAGYCELSTLLQFRNANSYTCGVYGWNFDCYELDGLTITTGYRGMIGEHVNGGAVYEQKAREIMDNREIPYEERKTQIESLLYEFAVLNGGF